ncbi:MAG: polysaccharide biosynthesis tyrosine autokinase [Candidatus Marinimicrobia bacterium]|nr:polysaccharide biosynthesis tyrosine autokinase [Candidatus Neomarinimicrobiota bacterium]
MEPQAETTHFLDYWRVVRARKEIIIAVAILVVLTGSAVTFMLPRIFMAQARILVRQDEMALDVFSRQPVMGFSPFFMRTQYEVIQSRPMLNEVVRNLDLQVVWGKTRGDGTPLSREAALRELRGSLKVEQYRETSLIAINVYREDPAEAMRIANEIAQVYRSYRLNQKRQEVRAGLDALQDELQKQQDVVSAAEERLEVLRSDLDIALIGRMQGVRADSMRVSQLEGDRIGARVDMLVRKARFEQLADLDGQELLNAIIYVVNDPLIANLRRQAQDVDVNLQLMLENLGENHPDVRQLLAGKAEIERQLNDALLGLKRGLRADYEIAKQKFEALEAELAQVREVDIAASSTKMLPFERADREVQVQRAILDAVRARLAQEGIELEVPRTPVDIIDPAEMPQRPVSPNFFLNIFLSLVLGLGAGIGLAYFIEYLDTSMKTVDEVERYLALPVLGIVPQKVVPLVDEGPESGHAEAYRVLRTNLDYAIRDRKASAFAVLSGGMGEGKSTTLFNLAYVCAIAGRKTLIVDSDMRRPVQHSFLGITNRMGLSNVLLRDVPVEEMIQSTSVPNLHILPSGKLPRSSYGLLESKRMYDLIQDLKARYEYVFFDSPPVMGLSDASVLASEVDGVLLVVQYRKYPREISVRAKRLIENVGGKIVGVVLNNINILRDDYYHYYHTYYSHYYSDDARLKEHDRGTDGVEDRL